MARLIIMKGLPGSGKSTRAKQLLKEQGNLLRVNRDELREMMLPDRWSGKLEEVITAAESDAVVRGLRAGYDVLVDDTNLNPKTFARWERFAAPEGVKSLRVEVEDLTSVPVAECVRRDSLRHDLHQRAVGPAVIYRMAFRYGLVKLPTDTVVVDIDGTLSDPTHRLHFIRQCKRCGCGPDNHEQIKGSVLYDHKFQKDWDGFFRELIKDPPRIGTIKWVQALKAAGHTIIVCSGRSDKYQWDTNEWLKMYEVPFDYLLMRRHDDFRQDYDAKLEMMNLIGKENVAFCIDDRKQVVDLYRSLGLKVYPVNGDGDY